MVARQDPYQRRDGTAGAYDGVQKSLHWLILALLVAQFLIAYTMPDVPNGQPPTQLVNAHLTIGITILVVMLVRLGYRLTHSVPETPKDSPRWERAAALATHYAFYFFLIVMPIAGWAWASAKGWPITIFGFIPLPHILPEGSPLRPLAARAHIYDSYAVLALFALHALAALRHRFIKHDHVLQRMLPGHDAVS